METPQSTHSSGAGIRSDSTHNLTAQPNPRREFGRTRTVRRTILNPAACDSLTAGPFFSIDLTVTFFPERRHTRFAKPLTTFASGTSRRGFCGPSHMRVHAQSRAHVECLVRHHSLYSEMRIAFWDSSAHLCTPVEAVTLPGRLRRHTARSPTPRRMTANSEHRFHHMPVPAAIP